ncbi:MAG: hypothetical protein CR991_07555 [Proteobacteria bacterium]|nr:MAG: hypothetical protein CR991_07555 [Pseudomonadota bacterium]
MKNLLVLLAVGLLIWFWISSLRSREQAIQAAARACRDIGAQLLDQTVALQSLRPARNARGRMVFRRIYAFEFSLAGYERRQGRAFMLGHKLEQIQLDQAEGLVIDVKSHSTS